MDLRQHSPITALEWDSYPFSDGDWSPCTMYDHFFSRHYDLCGKNSQGCVCWSGLYIILNFLIDYSIDMSENMLPNSDSELMKPEDTILRAESHMRWSWGEFPESTWVGFKSSQWQNIWNFCLYTFFPPDIQVNKKDKSEPKTLTITPSEKTHFRVILNTESMEEECCKIDPVCSIIKPEPRTMSFDHHNLKLQPHESSSCDTIFTNNQPELSDLTTGGFTSEPCPVNTEVGSKCARKTKWTSSPPSSRDSGSAANGGSTKAGPSTADSRATDSSSTKRGNTFIRCLHQKFHIWGYEWDRSVHVQVHETWVCGGRMWFECGLWPDSLCVLCIQEEEEVR